MYRSVLEEQVVAAEEAIRRAVESIDPDDVPAAEATRLFERLDRIVRTASAGRTLLARRVEDSLEWKRTGHRSAEEYLAATSGRSLAAARSEMDTSKALRDLAATRQGMVDGSLSPDQGATIASAARHNPGAERALIDKAGRSSLQELRDDAQRARAAADVTSLTRGPTQAMRYALLWTSPTCTVEGCTRTIVEHDHAWGAEFRSTRHTRLDELERMCNTHHDLHTHYGWALVRGTGKRPMVPPDHPQHPANASDARPPPRRATPIDQLDLLGDGAA